MSWLHDAIVLCHLRKAVQEAMRKSQMTMTDDDRTEMAQATKDAWAKTEAAMADRTPQFGYRPAEEIAKDIAKTWSVPEVSDIEIWKARALRAEHLIEAYSQIPYLCDECRKKLTVDEV